jgi:hypothetical protein
MVAKNYSKLIGFGLGILFFLIGLFTLSDYGLNVDEPIHFIRGQAYLHYLTTGKLEYSEKDLSQKRVSYWKNYIYTPKYFLKKDTGHPSFNDIMAAGFNNIFYERLGIIGDLEAYHLFELTISSLLITFIYFVVEARFGIFPATISALSLFLYPLYFAESKFNIKDPIETVFFSFSLYYLFKAFTGIKKRDLFIGIIFFAFAFATKFNVLFLPFILIPALLFHYFKKLRLSMGKIIKLYPLGFYFLLFISPLIIFGIYIYFRPYVWADPLNHVIETFKYYKDIGVGVDGFPDKRFIINGWNLYAPYFISITTPLQMLALGFVGLIYSVKKCFVKNDPFYPFVLFWLIVPIMRVMVPGMTIYSGVRQIMEYIPALAILIGIGVYAITDIIKLRFKKINIKYLYCFILGIYLPLVLTLIKIHPNENIYMNVFVGGLRGAYDKKIQGTGETMGNIYLQGIEWLNQNAESGSELGIAVGLSSNIPWNYLRADIKHGDVSGMNKAGEYVIEKISVGFPPSGSFYLFNYLNKFLIPVYEKKVDGVTLLKIWKNDVEHTKPEYLHEEILYGTKITRKTLNETILTFPSSVNVTRLIVDHESVGCIPKGEKREEISYSLDGDNWFFAGKVFPAQGAMGIRLQTQSRYVHFFASERMKFIRIEAADSKSCLLKARDVKIYYLKGV